MNHSFFFSPQLKRTQATSSKVDVHHRSDVFLHGTLQRIKFYRMEVVLHSFSGSPFLSEAYACILFWDRNMTKNKAEKSFCLFCYVVTNN